MIALFRVYAFHPMGNIRCSFTALTRTWNFLPQPAVKLDPYPVFEMDQHSRNPSENGRFGQ